MLLPNFNCWDIFIVGKKEGFEGDYIVDDQVKNSVGYDMALIGLESMQRANSTLEDFCRSYFMFHGLDVTRPKCLFKHLPLLSFTESYIYQLDSLNEKMVDLIRSNTTVGDQRSSQEACKVMRSLESEPFRPFSLLLEHHGLIREELRQGEEYWALERKLCCTSKQISIEDVMRAIHLKSFDYRVLNLLLYQLQEEKEDVLENNFNILRMFVRLYGTSTAPTMLLAHARVPVPEPEPEPGSISEIRDSGFGNRLRRAMPIFLGRVRDLVLSRFIRSMLTESVNITLAHARARARARGRFQIRDPGFGIWQSPAAGYAYLFGPRLSSCVVQARYIAETEEKYEELAKALDPELYKSYQTRCEEATKEGGKMAGHPLGSWAMPPLIVDEDIYRSSMQDCQ
ncbi:hypothetical protein KSS87_000572 [Heliosperma pusillum]|nr:hypothetical protein KSS87_000572 [Heliosperma pusillum]